MTFAAMNENSTLHVNAGGYLVYLMLVKLQAKRGAFFEEQQPWHREVQIDNHGTDTHMCNPLRLFPLPFPHWQWKH
jgi:hypothetical protein